MTAYKSTVGKIQTVQQFTARVLEATRKGTPQQMVALKNIIRAKAEGGNPEEEYQFLVKAWESVAERTHTGPVSEEQKFKKSYEFLDKYVQEKIAFCKARAKRAV